MAWIDIVVGFLAGSLCSFGIVGLWWARRFRLASGTTLTQRLAGYRLREQDPRTHAAHSRVKACKKRLRWQMNPNPYWMAPLLDEIPKLVREIAEIYYPDAPDPLRAPGLSHFMRALHLAAMDIADFLQTCRLGRLVDVSAETVCKGWEKGHRLARHEGIKRVHTWYKTFHPWYTWTRPVWQAVRFNSPWMWMSLAASNITIRTLQPAVIDIVARRAIELYSGQLAAHSSARTV